jgi:hypothetical protein
MTRKPGKRRLRFEDMLDKEGNFVLDAGTYGDDAQPAEETPAPKGRPSGSTSLSYEDIDPFLEFWLLHPKRLRQQVLFDLIRHVYGQKHDDSPVDSTLKARLAYLKSRSE